MKYLEKILLFVVFLSLILSAEARKSIKKKNSKNQFGGRTTVIKFKETDKQYLEGILEQTVFFDKNDQKKKTITKFIPRKREDSCSEQIIVYLDNNNKTLTNRYEKHPDGLQELVIEYNGDKITKQISNYDQDKVENGVVKEEDYYNEKEILTKSIYFYCPEYVKKNSIVKSVQKYRDDGTLDTMEIFLTKEKANAMGYDTLKKYFDEQGKKNIKVDFIRDGLVLQTNDMTK